MKLLEMSNFTFFHNVFYAMSIFKSFNTVATFQLSSPASLNFGRSQNGVLGNGLRRGIIFILGNRKLLEKGIASVVFLEMQKTSVISTSLSVPLFELIRTLRQYIFSTEYVTCVK